MTVTVKHYPRTLRPTPPRLIDLQAARHHSTCLTHHVGSNAARYCTCGLATSRALAGDRSTR